MTIDPLTVDELEAETREAELKAARPLFQRHLAIVKNGITFGYRSAAMLHWASLQTVFGQDPEAKKALDALLPVLKAMPVEPAAPAASPAPQGG